jgi:hypothetical protein
MFFYKKVLIQLNKFIKYSLSLANTKDSKILAFIRRRFKENTCPAILKILSTFAELAGTPRIFLEIFAKIGQRCSFSRQKSKTVLSLFKLALFT